MRHFYLLIILICVSKFVLGQGNVILPLSVGNYWEFEFDYGFSQDTSKVEITGSAIINYQNNDYEVFFWQWEGSSTKWLVRNQNDGLWAYGVYFTSDTLIAPELLLKYPASVGDTWQNNWSFIGIGDTVIVKCFVIDTILSVPAGSFSSYGYTNYGQSESKNSNRSIFSEIFKLKGNHKNTTNNQASNLQDAFYLFFSPDNGYIKNIAVENNSVVSEARLLSYNIVTSIKRTTSLKLDFLLYQNYPNPFNPTTTINFSIPKSSFVTINIYDALGREVTKLLSEEKPTGNYSVEFNGGQLTSGIYFYRMQAGDFVESKKLILLK